MKHEMDTYKVIKVDGSPCIVLAISLYKNWRVTVHRKWFAISVKGAGSLTKWVEVRRIARSNPEFRRNPIASRLMEITELEVYIVVQAMWRMMRPVDTVPR